MTVQKLPQRGSKLKIPNRFLVPFKVHLNRKRFKKFGCQKVKSKHFRAMFEMAYFSSFGSKIEVFLVKIGPNEVPGPVSSTEGKK